MSFGETIMGLQRFFQLFKKVTPGEWLTVLSALFGGLIAVMGFLLTPLADLPLLWLYGENFEVEVRGPTEITEGATENFNFVLFGLTRLGLSQGTAILETDEHLSLNESGTLFSFEATKAPIELSKVPILIKGQKRGEGTITVSVRTANKPKGYKPKKFKVNVRGRLSTRVTESDLTGEWRLYLQNTEGRMKLVQTGFLLEGTYEFDEAIHGKKEGRVEGHFEGIIHIYLEFGTTRQLFVNLRKLSNENAIQLEGEGVMQEKNQDGVFSDTGEKYRFLATAELVD